MAPRLALLLLFAGRTSAQLGCTSEEDLLANLRWVYEACAQEGEHFGEVDALVPTAVTTPGCAQVVRRVAVGCDGLFARSPSWFGSRRAALATAAASAAALEEIAGAPATFQMAEEDWPTVRTSGSVLEEGLSQGATIITGRSRLVVDLGPSCSHLRLDFEQLTLDQQSNDNMRLYSDADLSDEIMAIYHNNLPLAGPISPIDLPGRSSVHIMLVSDGASRHTSFRATSTCVCDNWQGSGNGKPPTCGPCATSPCLNGGICHVSTDVVDGRGGGHRRAQDSVLTCDLDARTADVNAACCSDGPAAACADGAPQSCDVDCARVLLPFWEDCATALRPTGSSFVAEVQRAARLCQAQVAGEFWWLSDGNGGHMRSYQYDYNCVCIDGWEGRMCGRHDQCSGVDCGDHAECNAGPDNDLTVVEAQQFELSTFDRRNPNSPLQIELSSSWAAGLAQAVPILQLSDGTQKRLGEAMSPGLPRPHGVSGLEPFVLRFEMYVGAGARAGDSLCAYMCGSDAASSLHEFDDHQITGTLRYVPSSGVTVCFTESQYAPDDIYLSYNGADLGSLANKKQTYADESWHTVELMVAPSTTGGAEFSLAFDGVALVPSVTVASYALATPAHIGFTGQTGIDTNQHWVRAVAIGTANLGSAMCLPT